VTAAVFGPTLIVVCVVVMAVAAAVIYRLAGLGKVSTVPIAAARAAAQLAGHSVQLIPRPTRVSPSVRHRGYPDIELILIVQVVGTAARERTDSVTKIPVLQAGLAVRRRAKSLET
jgi:hypothetical protein